MTTITREELSGITNPLHAKEAVTRALDVAYSGGVHSLIAMFNHYASWNGNFAGCMTRLAADVSEAKTIFVDTSLTHLNDRANLVASHIFDTVRDEFNDSGSPQRDTHRTLAQAMILGMLQYYKLDNPPDIAAALAPKDCLGYVLKELNHGFHPNGQYGLYEGIGFHLGSEFFGDIEYTMIDNWLGANIPELQTYLKNTFVVIDGVRHNCYVWVRIHSGAEEGLGVEADHFDMAITGANKALEFSILDRATCKTKMLYGAKKFSEQQQQFFNTVNASKLDVTALELRSSLYQAARKTNLVG